MKKHTNQKDKREQIKQHLKTHWEMSNRAVGRALGVHHSTVSSVRTEMEQSGRFSHLSTAPKDGIWKNHPYLQSSENKVLLETPSQLSSEKEAVCSY